MTPKQKAQELIERFSEHSIYWDYYNDEPPDEDHTKECVLICINEIIKTCKKNIKSISYWQEVRKEIENY